MGFFSKIKSVFGKKKQEQPLLPALEQKPAAKVVSPAETATVVTPEKPVKQQQVEPTKKEKVVEESVIEEVKTEPVVEPVKAEEPVVEAPKAEVKVEPVVESVKPVESIEVPKVEEKTEAVVEPIMAAESVEAPKAEVKAEPAIEPEKAEKPVETPKAEVKAEPVDEPEKAEKPVETPKAEVKVEPAAEPVKAEKPVETPKAEVKAEPAVEPVKAEEPAVEEAAKAEEKPKRTRKTTAKKAEPAAEGEEAAKPKRTRKTPAKKAEEPAAEGEEVAKPKRTRKTAAKKTEPVAEGEEAAKPKRTRKTTAKKAEPAAEGEEAAKPKRTRKPAAKKTESAQDDSSEGVSSQEESTSQEKSTSQETSSENRSDTSRAASSEQVVEPAVEPSAQVEEPVVEPAPLVESVAPVAAVAPVAEEPAKLSFFSRLKKTREHFTSGFSALIKGRKIDEDLYEELETDLLTADLGIHTTNYIIERLRNESTLRDLHDAAALRENLNKMLCEILEPSQSALDVTSTNGKPFVILMVGVNGAGKTTTIGKLAAKYKARGLKVLLAAGDTFRAAAVEQLKEWGTRTDVPVISQPTGSDAASVIYDAVTAAVARKYDVLICDTAGRLQNKAQLMDELEKIVRVMKKIDPSYPNETLLVLDSATGQNAVSQTQIFTEKVSVSGLALTKLDGTARGGIVFSLSERFGLPIRFIGLGEKPEDLRDFEVKAFVDSVLREDA